MISASALLLAASLASSPGWSEDFENGIDRWTRESTRGLQSFSCCEDDPHEGRRFARITKKDGAWDDYDSLSRDVPVPKGVKAFEADGWVRGKDVADLSPNGSPGAWVMIACRDTNGETLAYRYLCGRGATNGWERFDAVRGIPKGTSVLRVMVLLQLGGTWDVDDLSIRFDPHLDAWAGLLDGDPSDFTHVVRYRASYKLVPVEGQGNATVDLFLPLADGTQTPLSLTIDGPVASREVVGDDHGRYLRVHPRKIDKVEPLTVEVIVALRASPVEARWQQVRLQAIPAKESYPAEVRAWLAPNPYVQSDDAAVKEALDRVRAEVAKRQGDPARLGDLVDAVVDHVARLPRATHNAFDAVSVLKGGSRDCLTSAAAICALLRAAGIPARVPAGIHALYYAPNRCQVHTAVEAWAPGAGWFLLDGAPPASLRAGTQYLRTLVDMPTSANAYWWTPFKGPVQVWLAGPVEQANFEQTWTVGQVYLSASQFSALRASWEKGGIASGIASGTASGATTGDGMDLIRYLAARTLPPAGK